MNDGSLGALLQSANVRSISIRGIADEQRSLALELAAHATLQAYSEDADAVAIVAGTGGATLRDQLDVATEGLPPLVIVLDPTNGRRKDVERWVSGHDGWLMMEHSPVGSEVVAPIETLTRCADLFGVWRGGPAPGAEYDGSRPLVANRAPVPESGEADKALTGQLARLRITSESQRIELDRVRGQLRDDRMWVASEAERVRTSSSWRIGHRLVRIARLLTFRRDMGSDALTRLVERMRAPVGR